MILYGVDEAALGPVLGPLCVCRTEFVLNDGETKDLYTQLGNVVARRPDGSDRLVVGDSKTIYSPRKGLDLLEDAVLAFLSAAGMALPSTLAAFVHALAVPEDCEDMADTPWFAENGSMAIPFAGGNENERKTRRHRLTALLTAEADSRNLVIRPQCMRFVTARRFNRQLASGQNKAEAVQTFMTPLLRDFLCHGRREPKCATVDRQGGRQYYGSWLSHIHPAGSFSVVEEGSARSVYRSDGTEIHFVVKADQKRMETALASMFAKYLRESAMRAFNTWWVRRIPGIRPTAGYPQDARRFIRDLETTGALPTDKDILIRQR